MWLLFKDRGPQNDMLPTPTLGGLSLNIFGKEKKMMWTDHSFLNVIQYMAIAKHIRFDLFPLKILH
jgi:hypothetical protein